MADRAQSAVGQLWAKTQQGGERWHALPYHLLDVGATAEALWETLPESCLSVPRDALGDKATAKAVSVFLAASHDVGKANRFFQSKDKTRAAALGLPNDLPEPYRHGYATGSFLKPWLIVGWGWSEFVATNIAKAVGGHHGTYYPETNLEPLRLNDEPWRCHGSCLLNETAEVLGVLGLQPEPTNLNAYLGWLSGFVCVADWLGSHEAMTVWETGDRNSREYLDEARTRAQKLLRETRWVRPPETTPMPLAQLVPDGFCVNELQQAAEGLARHDFGLAIVEAPTGEGKTEAAFALTEPHRSRGAGVYFALPTMATANGLFARVESYLTRATGNADMCVRLLHSQAWLYHQHDGTIPDPADEAMAAEAEDWFAGSKRALLAPYGVGTIDQALLAALRTRHGFVRLFALAGKTIVVDEVHAYDVYMSDLLERLLGWLRALGCRVILLSATLPKTRRAGLLAAWGASAEQPAEYPCITWVGASGDVCSRQFGVAKRKPLCIRLAERGSGEESWAAGAKLIWERVHAHGGCGALVLNTVGGAQNAYQWLKDNATGLDLTLFHGRFTAKDREAIEKDVLRRFGKNGPRNLPAILVATQVVEQSLDLDFDHMVSALAPIDLLIQRAGRLHRHRRTATGQLLPQGEPDERPNPVLEVIPPKADGQEVPALQEPVYAHDILLRTENLLRSPLYITEAAHVSTAVEAVYSGHSPDDDRQSWLEHFEVAVAKEQKTRERSHDVACEVVIPPAAGRVPLTHASAFLVEDDDAPGSQILARTRLEDLPSLTLALLSPNGPSPEQMPSSAEKRALAMACIRVSAQGKRFRELLDLPRAGGWSRVKALREVRPVILGEDGAFATESFTYHYCSEYGLRWSKNNA